MFMISLDTLFTWSSWFRFQNQEYFDEIEKLTPLIFACLSIQSFQTQSVLQNSDVIAEVSDNPRALDSPYPKEKIDKDNFCFGTYAPKAASLIGLAERLRDS